MITLRIEAELKEFLHEYAAKDRRKLSNFLLHTATTYIRENWGVNWEDVRLDYIKRKMEE